MRTYLTDYAKHSLYQVLALFLCDSVYYPPVSQFYRYKIIFVNFPTLVNPIAFPTCMLASKYAEKIKGLT